MEENMKTEISLELIKKFNSLYNTKENREDEKHIIEEGIYDYILDRNVIKENKREFGVELPQLKRENQQESSRCWIYAGINFLKFEWSTNNVLDDGCLRVVDDEYVIYDDTQDKRVYISTESWCNNNILFDILEDIKNIRVEEVKGEF